MRRGTRVLPTAFAMLLTATACSSNSGEPTIVTVRKPAVAERHETISLAVTCPEGQHASPHNPTEGKDGNDGYRAEVTVLCGDLLPISIEQIPEGQTAVPGADLLTFNYSVPEGQLSMVDYGQGGGKVVITWDLR